MPESDPYWDCFLLLLEITSYLLAPRISEDEVAYLNVLIPEHHKIFVELYPEASVIPKMHYLIHAPCLIIKY